MDHPLNQPKRHKLLQHQINRLLRNRPQGAAQVEISADQQKLIGVKTAKVAYQPMKKVIRTVGRMEADESRQSTINAKN